MIERGKISALQMAMLMYPNIVATAILTSPGISFKYAERDMWISPLWGSLSGFLVVFVIYRLHKLYPNDTPVEYCQHILGPFLGKLVGFIFLSIFLFISGLALRQYGDFLVGVFLPHTPITWVMGALALASALAVRAGLEVLARLSDMFVPIVILLWLAIVLLLLPELDTKNLFPVMEYGIGKSLMGAVAPVTWIALFFFISFLLPYLTDRKQGLKWGMLSVVLVTATLFTTNLATLLLFGGITGHLVYPVMDAARYISYADFLENLESVVMAIWISGTFIKLGITQYLLSLGTAQWLNLSDYKPLVFPYALLGTLFGVWVAPNLMELTRFLQVTMPFLISAIFIVIPVSTLIIALLQNRKHKKRLSPRS